MSYLISQEVQEKSIIVIDYLSKRAPSELFFIHEVKPSLLNENVIEIMGQNLSCILRSPLAHYPFSPKNTKVLKMSVADPKMIQSGVRGYRKMNQKESEDLAKVFGHFKNSLDFRIKELYDLLEPAVFQKVENNTKARIVPQSHNARISSVSARG